MSVVNPRTTHREHRKLLAVDGRVAFLGEFNIGELYTTWRGTHLRVRGEGARSISRAFADFWNTHRSEDLPEIPPVRKDAWDPSTNLLVNDPYRHALPIRAAHLRAVGRAGTFGSKGLDASLLLLPKLGFVDYRDERMVGTTNVIREDSAKMGCSSGTGARKRVPSWPARSGSSSASHARAVQTKPRRHWTTPSPPATTLASSQRCTTRRTARC